MKKWKIVETITYAFVVFLLSGMPVKAAEDVHENNVKIIADALVKQKDYFTLQKENGDEPDFVSEYREACNVNHNAFYFSIYNIEEITFIQDDNFVHYKISYNSDRENIERSLQDTLEDFVSQYGDISQYSDQKKFAAVSDYIIENYEYNQNKNGNPIFESLDISLPKKKIVCGGYSALVSYLCDFLDIESKFCWSDTHVWNTVSLSGQMFYVDGTKKSSPFISENEFYNCKDYKNNSIEAEFSDWKNDFIYTIYQILL